MTQARVELLPDSWIVQNPWLHNAFRRAPAARTDELAPPGVADCSDTVPDEMADLDGLVRRLRECDDQVIARVCAAIGRRLEIEPSTDRIAELRHAAAVGLAIGFALRQR